MDGERRGAGQPLAAADTLTPSFPGGVLSSYPQIAVDGSGNTLAVWSGGFGSSGTAYWAYRPAGGDFSTGDELGTANFGFGSPRVTFRPDGGAVAVWVDPDGSVKAAERPAGAATDFDPLDDLAPAGSADRYRSFGTAIAAAADGRVAVLWGEAGTSGPETVRAAVKRPGEARFDPAETVGTTPAQDAVNPSIAFRADGGLDALWRIDTLAGIPWSIGGSIVASERAAAGSWSTPSTLASLPVTSSDMAFTAPGSAAAGLCEDSTLAVWGSEGGLAASAIRGDGTVEQLAPLPGLASNIDPPSLATTPDGTRGIVLWTSTTDGTAQTNVALFADPGGELCT